MLAVMAVLVFRFEHGRFAVTHWPSGVDDVRVVLIAVTTLVILSASIVVAVRASGGIRGHRPVLSMGTREQ